MDPEIKADFPALTDENHTETSPVDFNYNCLAFALGDKPNWWEPPGLFGHYWPPGFPEDNTVETVISILKLHGFKTEIAPAVKPDEDSIAIYAEAGEWTHFARFTNGVWLSKLGEGKDIQHLRPQDLEGTTYGRVVRVLMRSRRDSA